MKPHVAYSHGMALSLKQHLEHFVADVSTEVQDALHFDMRRQQVTVIKSWATVTVTHKSNTVTFTILTEEHLQTVLIIENGDEQPTRRTIPISTRPEDVAKYILAALT